MPMHACPPELIAERLTLTMPLAIMSIFHGRSCWPGAGIYRRPIKTARRCGGVMSLTQFGQALPNFWRPSC